MPLQFSIPKFAAHMPWWMYDIDNNQLITAPTVPEQIKDEKNIVLAEVTIPGLNYAPFRNSSNGNRTISFMLKLVKRNNTVGNVLILKQFEQLRNQRSNLFDIYPQQFAQNPKVLYSWGTGSTPLIYRVSKCGFTSNGMMVNELGNPKYTEIEIELKLDEEDPLYVMEETFRKLSATSSAVISGFEIAISMGRNYKTV